MTKKTQTFLLTVIVVTVLSCESRRNFHSREAATADSMISSDTSLEPQEKKIPVDSKPLALRSIYEKFNLDGLFLLFDPAKNLLTDYNKSLANDLITPASTFNIITALIALEEGICNNENSIIKWRGHISRNPDANRDIPLKYGFQHNVDWVFWELRKKIGSSIMNRWLKKLSYGNRIVPDKVDSIRYMEAGIDTFWVVSPIIRITPIQQLQLMLRLQEGSLPFSKHNQDIIKKLMFEREINGFKIYGKRGSYRLRGEKKYIGWFIGFAENEKEARIFVNFIQTPNLEHSRIVNAQKESAFEILGLELKPSF